MRLTNEEKVEIVLIVGNNYRTTRQAADEFKNFSVNFFKRGRDQDNDNNNLPVGYNEDDELNILLYLEENPKTILRQISRDFCICAGTNARIDMNQKTKCKNRRC